MAKELVVRAIYLEPHFAFYRLRRSTRSLPTHLPRSSMICLGLPRQPAEASNNVFTVPSGRGGSSGVNAACRLSRCRPRQLLARRGVARRASSWRSVNRHRVRRGARSARRCDPSCGSAEARGSSMARSVNARSRNYRVVTGPLVAVPRGTDLGQWLWTGESVA
jgi:hypothetical protein